MSGTSWRYDARQMAVNADLVPEFVEPDMPAADADADTEWSCP